MIDGRRPSKASAHSSSRLGNNYNRRYAYRNPTVVTDVRMKSEHIEIIKNEIAPLMERGEIALLLGAGFSYKKNPSIAATIPGSEELKGILLGSCGKTGGPSTRLKDVYDLASRSLPEYKKNPKGYFFYRQFHL